MAWRGERPLESDRQRLLRQRFRAVYSQLEPRFSQRLPVGQGVLRKLHALGWGTQAPRGRAPLIDERDDNPQDRGDRHRQQQARDPSE